MKIKRRERKERLGKIMGGWPINKAHIAIKKWAFVSKSISDPTNIA